MLVTIPDQEVLVGDMLSEQFSALVRSELERQGLTVTELARRLGLPRSNVSRQINAEGTVMSTTVVAYLAALNVDPDLRAATREEQRNSTRGKKQ